MIGKLDPEENVMDYMKPDMYVGWEQHLKNGNVWRIEIELPMQDSPEDDPNYLSVNVDVVAPTRDLACYIVSAMYPDYESMCSNENPISSQ